MVQAGYWQNRLAAHVNTSYPAMNPLSLSFNSVPHDQFDAHLQRVMDHIRDTDQPNFVGAEGQTCLLLALALVNTEGGDARIGSLLQRGADPNLPTAMANFQAYMTNAKQTNALAMLIDAGMKLNVIYAVEPETMPTQRAGLCTLLDYALDVEAYLNRRSKRFIKTVEKHAGPLSSRRRIVTDSIELLRSRGALSAEAG